MKGEFWSAVPLEERDGYRTFWKLDVLPWNVIP